MRIRGGMVTLVPFVLEIQPLNTSCIVFFPKIIVFPRIQMFTPLCTTSFSRMASICGCLARHASLMHAADTAAVEILSLDEYLARHASSMNATEILSHARLASSSNEGHECLDCGSRFENKRCLARHASMHELFAIGPRA